VIKNKKMSNGFESFLIPKIYEYAKLEENRTIKKLREELDEYRQTLKKMKMEDDLQSVDFMLYSICDNCFHTIKTCPICKNNELSCRWCKGVEKCGLCDK